MFKNLKCYCHILSDNMNKHVIGYDMFTLQFSCHRQPVNVIGCLVRHQKVLFLNLWVMLKRTDHSVS